MERRIDLFNVFKNEGLLKTVYVYAATETITDPYEKNETKVYANPLPIQAVVRQISWEALRWKYTGQLPSKSIEIIAEKKYKTIFKTAEKIKYGEDYYKCWKDDSKNFMIIERDDYVVVILGLKNES